MKMREKFRQKLDFFFIVLQNFRHKSVEAPNNEKGVKNLRQELITDKNIMFFLIHDYITDRNVMFFKYETSHEFIPSQRY